MTLCIENVATMNVTVLVATLVVILCISVCHTSEAWLSKRQFLCSPWYRLHAQQYSTTLGVKQDGEADEIDRRWENILKELDDSSTPSVDSVGDLRNVIRQEGFRKTPRTRLLKDKEYLQSKDFTLNSDSLSQLEDILGDQIVLEDPYDQGADNTLKDASKLLDDEDSIFLDAETYIQYSNSNNDGEVNANVNFDMGVGRGNNYDGYNTFAPSSISEKELLEFAMPPDAPYTNTGDKEPTFDDILALQQRMGQRRPPSPHEEKEIFDEVTREEQAYLEQTSKIFREGLTNKTAAQEATNMRRSSQYRKNLFQELNKLEQQIQEFEILLQEEVQKSHGMVSNQNVEGDDPITNDIRENDKRTDEVVITKEFTDDVNAPLHEPLHGPGEDWVLVDDPSTGEIFYWNSVTGEMKFDLASDEDGNK